MVEICRNCRLRNQEITVEVILFEYSRRSLEVFQTLQRRESVRRNVFTNGAVFVVLKIYWSALVVFLQNNIWPPPRYTGYISDENFSEMILTSVLGRRKIDSRKCLRGVLQSAALSSWIEIFSPYLRSFLQSAAL